MMHRRLLAVSLVAAGLLSPFLAGCGAPPAPGQTSSIMQSSQGRPMGVRNDFENAKEVPISASTHFAAGQFAESQGNNTQALEQYRKALKLDPSHRDSLFRMAIVFVKSRQFNEAIETWNKYITVTQGDATAYANLGFAYELASRTSEAEQAYLKGIRREPTNAACRVNYGLLLARKERFNEATMQFQTVLGEADVHYNLASVYEDLGRREQAKIEYKKAIAVNPNMKEAQVRLDEMK